MKKIIATIMTVFLLVGMLAGCSPLWKDRTSNKLKIVTTIFPEYDWVREILGDKEKDADITMLLDNGVDLHSYQPTSQDILKISNCDMFLYVGGESDGWVEDVLKEAENKDMVVINLLEVLGDSVKTEEMVEGMQAPEEEHKENPEGEKEEEEEQSQEADEHVWLSLKNAKVLCSYIAGKLGSLDRENAELYEENAQNYMAKLEELDGEYQSAADSSDKKILLFGDRFPFRYLVDDYGLDYYAAFVGCSAETEASFEAIAFLAKKTDELELPGILTIEGREHKIAETVVSNTRSKDQKILTMDSMQSTTSQEAKEGKTYLSVMEKNLEVLKQALE